MLAEMAAFSQERESSQAGRAAAEAQLAEERQRFEAAARAQVGCQPACWWLPTAATERAAAVGQYWLLARRCHDAAAAHPASLLLPPLCLQREELDADRERLHSEFEGLMGKHQERAVEWEAAAQEEEAGIAHRKQVS